MPQKPRLTIDQEACTACWQCVEDCPAEAITRGARAQIDGARCIGCGHCGAVCPPGAVKAEEGDFPPWSPPSLPPAEVRALLVGRRSMRHYQSRELGPGVIEEVLSVGAHAPTASNAREIEAIVVQGERVRALAAQINACYHGFCRMLTHPLLRPLLWLTAARPYLKDARKLEHIRQRVAAFSEGKDWIFFRAPAVVILTAPSKHRTFGRVDAAIAAERMLAYAFSLGLGSCMIGYAELALQRSRAVRDGAGVSRDRVAHMVFTLGYPALAYRRLPVRSRFPVRWLDTHL